jgi:hypothetical protein
MIIKNAGVVFIKTSPLHEMPPVSESGEHFTIQPALAYSEKVGDSFNEMIQVFVTIRDGDRKAGLVVETAFEIKCEGDVPLHIEETNMIFYADMLQAAISHARFAFFVKAQNTPFGEWLLPLYTQEELIHLLRQAKRQALN